MGKSKAPQIRFILTTLLFLSFHFLFASPPSYSFDEINNFEAAKSRAGQSGKLIFVEFSARWCMPCKMMEESTLMQPEIKQILSANYISVKMDIDNPRVKSWKEHFQVFLVPTLLILDSKGNLLERTEKTLSSQPFKNLILKHNKTSNKTILNNNSIARNNRTSTGRPSYTRKASTPIRKVQTRNTKVERKTSTVNTTIIKKSNSSTRSANSTNSSRTKVSSKTRVSRTAKQAKKINAQRKAAIKKRQKGRHIPVSRKTTRAKTKPVSKSKTIRNTDISLTGRQYYTIQIGKYSKFETAKEKLTKINKLNRGLAKLIEYREGRKKKYKIHIGNYRSKTQGNDLLRTLKRKGYANVEIKIYSN